MRNEKAYQIIKELVDHNGNRNRAAVTLGCSKRTIDRYIVGYKAEGKAYFIHGNRGRTSARKTSDELKSDIIDVYNGKYYDANFAHFTELLAEYEKIHVSESLVRSIMSEADILSPKARRKTRSAYKQRLKSKLDEAKTTKEAEKIKVMLIEAEDAHPRRSRCSKFGEMIQMDASIHVWFGEEKATLHIAIDDATNRIVGAWFDLQETLNGYYNIFMQILINYGIPYMFYTDRRTVFEYRKSGSKDVADDTFTQFGYACKQLGVDIKTTSVAQAKGRVERLFETLQSRLPVELRLKGVTTIEQANEYLAIFVEKYNAKFALPHNNIPSVFEKQPSLEKIDMTLAVITERTVDTGHSIRFENKYYRTLNENGTQEFIVKGTKGLVIRTFSGALYYSIDDLVFALDEIPLHEKVSRNFDVAPPPEKPKKIHIPPANHPWRHANFTSYANRQQHRAA